MDTTVLSYHDSLLKQSDVDLLNGNGWLNDKILGFYFEYMEKAVFEDFNENVQFITPDVTQLIKLYEASDLCIFLEPLNLPQKQLIFLIVNNNESHQTGGTHWSLLVFYRSRNTFVHYDSGHGINLSAATKCAHKLTTFISAASTPVFINYDKTPQQLNSHDCGVYALCFAEVICRKELLQDQQSILSIATPEYVTKWRSKISDLIHRLANK